MGNLDAMRDWGHARDHVEQQWRMLQQETPEDFVIATGRQESVRHFIELSARSLGWGELRWEGHGPKEVGRRADTNAVVIRIDPRYFRPAEVETLLGDASEAHKRLGWKPCITLEELVEEMITQDREDARKEAYLRREGFQVVGPRKHDDETDKAQRSHFYSRCKGYGWERDRPRTQTEWIWNAC